MKQGRKRATLEILTFKYIQFAVSIATGVLLVPIYLTYIPAADYGLWLLASSVATWLTVADPGIAQVIVQRVSTALGANDQRSARGYIASGIFCSLVAAILILIAGWPLSQVAPEIFNLSQHRRSEIAALLGISVFSIAIIIFGYALSAAATSTGQNRLVGMNNLVSSIVNVATIVVLLHIGTGVLAFSYAQLVAAILFAVFTGIPVLRTVRSLPRHESNSQTIEQLRELGSLFTVSFGGRMSKAIAASIDNVLIGTHLGTGAVAVFAFTSTAARQSENFVGQSLAAVRPALSHLRGEGKAEVVRDQTVRLVSLMLWVAGLAVSGLAIFNDSFVHLWVGPENFAGTSVSIAICLMFGVNLWVKTLGNISFSYGDIRKNSLVELASAFAIVPMAWVGVSTGGMFGLALAHVATSLLLQAWYYPLAVQRLAGLGRTDITALGRTLLAVIGSGSVATAVSLHIAASSWATFSAAAAAHVLIYAIGLSAASRYFRMHVQHLIRRMRGPL